MDGAAVESMDAFAHQGPGSDKIIISTSSRYALAMCAVAR